MRALLVLPPLFGQSPSTSVQDVSESSSVKVGFYRLSIMDPTHSGDQPFSSPCETQFSVCNGEIYNHEALRQEVLDRSAGSVVFRSHSDCEVLLPLYAAYGITGMLQRLDGEFAFAIVDYAAHDILVARDPMGIRPLFYGSERQSGKLLFASEAKVLHDVCADVTPFPPGTWYSVAKRAFTTYKALDTVSAPFVSDMTLIKQKIRTLLVAAVEKRLQSDVPLGFLLSGGLDSSLVCAIAAASKSFQGAPLVTFAVGLQENPIDIGYARDMATALGSTHHEVLFTMDDVRAHLSELIYQLETWDVTTIRASIGMSLLCRYIRKHTSIRAVLTGEVSDELFGYKYTDFAPSAAAFQEEAAKRIRELYMYDVLRADRCIALHSLEARVPFSDTEFVEFVMSIDPSLKMNRNGVGKFLLRTAFDGTMEEDFPLPSSILWREKAAFSDAVGHGMVDALLADAALRYTDAEFEAKRMQLPEQGRPLTKEGLMYREIFESYYPGRSAWIVDYWLPNQEWEHCRVVDPSARMLPNYGQSGI